MTTLWVALAVALDGAAGLAGAILPERWLVHYRPTLLGFAAGALLAAALLDLVPEAIAANGMSVLPWLLASIVALAVFEWMLPMHDHHDHVGGVTPYALVGSDALHNFGDGIAIAAAFLSSTRLGVITSVAVIVHEVPQEVADYAILRAAKLGFSALLSVGDSLGREKFIKGFGSALVPHFLEPASHDLDIFFS